MSRRRYDQYCGLARALDVVGERWTLLVVRELLLGPQRYKDLLAALDGIGTNLLAQRLKDLEAAGVIRRASEGKRPPYELTDLGDQLREPILGLARWGLPLLGERRADDQVRPSWGMLGLESMLHPERTAGMAATYQFDIDGDVFSARVNDGTVEVRQGPAARPDLWVKADSNTFLEVGARALTPTDAMLSGRMVLEGDPNALVALARAMGLGL